MAEHPRPDLSDTSSLYAAKLLNASTGHRTFLTWAGGLCLVALAALFLPWQQFVSGKGKVTALRPQDRPQTIPAVITGRIEAWLVAEGQFVKAGTPIVQISEVKEKFLDPQLIDRIGEQVTGKRDAVDSKLNKVISMDSLIIALEQSLVLSLDKGANKVRLYEAAYEAAVLDSTVYAQRLARREQLLRDGLVSQVDLETFRLQLQQANAKLVEKRQEMQNARIELNSVRAEYSEKIAKAKADRNATRAEIGEGQAEVAKLRNEYRSMQLRAGFYRITAPQDGYVVKAQQAGIGDIIKEGEPIVTVQPASPALAVELYLRPMDVPLVQHGRKVRLQFDGWPALQFVGWPSVAVGTFGGVVQVIDYTASPDGQFRVLVTPDPADAPWPAQLRIGGGANGWAMLDRVRVWFELWRQLNGFPPSVKGASSGAPGGADAGKAGSKAGSKGGAK
jgi:adhesin transport system membrane fusion protein